MNSIWSSGVNPLHFPHLDKDIKTDVLIIGGGMAGLLCAHFLHLRGVNYVLAEGKTISSGITENTTAKITSQHGLIYSRLLKKQGVENAKLYFAANENALRRYRELCGGMDCDFEERDSYIYSVDNLKKLSDEVNALQLIGGKASLASAEELPFDVAGAVKLERQGQFNPLKFIGSISRGLNIYEHTFVRGISGHTAFTHRGKITANKIIIATHFPFINKHGMYFMKMYQHRSYVIALKNAGTVKGMYADEKDSGFSFRSYGDLLLLGGGGHRTGKIGGSYGELRRFAGLYYPNATEVANWATQDCMTLDKVPYIGKYSLSTPYLYVITGFNKWGMTSSMVGAEVLADIITGQKNPYIKLFSPSRSMMTPQLFVNGFESAMNLLSPTTRRCSHMGCGLKWNKYEHSWDCSCHGSRFTEQGGLIDNPAMRDIKNPNGKN